MHLPPQSLLLLKINFCTSGTKSGNQIKPTYKKTEAREIMKRNT